MAGDLTAPAQHALAADAHLETNLKLWGVAAIVSGLDQPGRVVLDRLPAVAQRADGWTAQAGTTSARTTELRIEQALDCGELGSYRIKDIEHDGHGWAVLQLAAL